jgi:chorismate mutase/prephenate dehydrogenase
MATEDLARLREAMADVDRQIVELAAVRAHLAARIGEVKNAQGEPIRDFSREKDVVDRARELAAGAGLSEELAESLMLDLIESSLAVQEQGRVRSESAGSGRTALVIGGLGHMGRWFVGFLDSQGFEVVVADPEESGEGIRDWRDALERFDVYVVATPIPVAATILDQMADDPPKGLIFDIGSLKTPLREALTRLAAAGAKVASIHPMFGADASLLSGRHVAVVDVGVPEAVEEVRALFSSTMAAIVEMDLDSHDRLIAYILGLSHALNIAFFTALTESGEGAARLTELSSTTFDRQLAVAGQVARENPNLYFEIQYLNEYGGDSLRALAEAVELIRRLVDEGDNEGFARLMESGAAYLDESRRPS